MFQMINDDKSTQEEKRRILLYKVGLFLAASAVVAGLMYFAFTGALTY